MEWDPFHPGILDPQLLLKEGDLAVAAVDPGTQADLTILTVGRPGQEYREGVMAQSQDVEDGGADAMLPAARQGQFRGHRDLREILLWEGLRRS